MNPGETVSHFEILGLLGAGGMGQVYRARDVRLGREVALKVLPAPLASDPERLRRFEQEARAAGALSHPNILALYDVGTHDGAPYLVTELLEGETLRERLLAGALAPRKAIELAVAVAHGLAAAHAKGIVHRDLKPGNVFVTTNGVVKILDFGLAKLTHPDADIATAQTVKRSPEDTASGMLLGTVGYMAPEQVRGQPVDHRADLFALGCVLYEMLSGRRAFMGETLADVMSAILSQDPPPLGELGVAVPAALAGILDRCLEKRPEDRFSSAHDVALALEAVSGSGEPAPSWPTARRRKARTHAVLAVLGGVAAVAALVVAVAAWQRRHGEGRFTAVSFQLFSTFPGSHRWPTFSPDGSMVAFVSDADGTPQIWVKNLAGGDPIRITSGKLSPSHPSWSPKNDQIVFQGGESLESQGIWSVPPLGGPSRRIVEFGFSPSVSSDGLRIAFQRNIMGVFVCNADGTGEQRVAGVPNDAVCALEDGPAFSPDGEQLAYCPALSGEPGLWVVPVRGGEARLLTTHGFACAHPVFTPDGRAILFSSTRGGSRNLWRVATTGGTPEPITTGAGDDDEPALPRDGTRLLYANVRNAYALMTLDVASGESRQVLEQRGRIGSVGMSPAGDRIAFASSTGRGSRLFLVGSDGEGLRPLGAASEDSSADPQFSADGESLYFCFLQAGPTLSFRKVSLAGGPGVELAPGCGSEMWGSEHVAPDGRRAAYDVAQDGTSVATFVCDLATGAKTRLALGIQFPRWSNDGRFLVGHTRNEMQLFICPPSEEPCSRVGAVEDGLAPFWSPDDSQILFLAPGNPPITWELRTVNRDGTGEKRLAVLAGLAFPEGLRLPGISRQGTLPWVQLRPGRRELWIAELHAGGPAP